MRHEQEDTHDLQQEADIHVPHQLAVTHDQQVLEATLGAEDREDIEDLLLQDLPEEVTSVLLHTAHTLVVEIVEEADSVEADDVRLKGAVEVVDEEVVSKRHLTSLSSSTKTLSL